MPKQNREKPNIPNILDYNSILIGLLGHVDSGKTAIARVISEIISTSGLDAHPQSKERGITIDLGFTSLILDNNLITLVDAPGHADLIKSVVASANIIEGAIVVIDGKEGIQIQAAEHLVILESLGIKNIIVTINKVDLISEEQAVELEKKIRITLSGSIFGNEFPIVKVSAKDKIGIDELKNAINILIGNILKTRERKKSEIIPKSEEKGKEKDRNGISKTQTLIYPIDHHFKIKGMGVIVTGTILSGNISIGDTLTILPQKTNIKIKSLQVYYQNVNSIPAGFRAGASILGIDADQMVRGNIITNNPSIFTHGDILDVKLNFNKYFNKLIHFGAQISVTLGLITVSARIFPYKISGEKREKLLVKEVDLSSLHGNNVESREKKEDSENIRAFLWLQDTNFSRKGQKLLLSQLDLPPTVLRFFGMGIIDEILPPGSIPELIFFKEKVGKIKNAEYGNNRVLIEGLAQNKRGADTLINKELEFPLGKIISTFGSKGVVIANICKINSADPRNPVVIKNGDNAILRLVRTIKLQKDKSYVFKN